MFEGIYSKDIINTGRQKEVDYLKAFSIIMMIITHCIDDLFDYEGHMIAEIIDDQLAQIVGAQAFMICMGLGIVFAKRVRAKDYLKRGIDLLIIGQVLNIIRFAVPGMILYYIFPTESIRSRVFLIISSDILQFAGLFFICMALFVRLDLKPFAIFIVSVACNIIGMATAGRITTGSYAADQLLGLVFFTETESYFPLLHWMIFPAFGILLGEFLMHIKDKKKFYTIAIIPSAIVFAAYFIVDAYIEQNVFTLYSEWTSFCSMSLPDAAASIISCMFMLSAFYFISLISGKRIMGCVSFISKNINRYYCTHYFFVLPLSLYLGHVAGLIENGIVLFVVTVVIITLTTLVVLIYDRYLVKSFHEFFGRRKLMWQLIVIALTILFAVWAYQARVEEFPNLMNDYSIDA